MRRVASIYRICGMLAILAMVASCAEIISEPTSKAPRKRPENAQPLDQAELRKARAERNREANRAAASSPSQVAYYAAIQDALVAAGKLRRDRVPLDAPIDADMLADHFVQIALYDEYGPDGSRGAVASDLRRWERPVRLHLEFGASVDRATQVQIRSTVSDYARRLGRAAGHDVALTDRAGNFTVLVLNDGERRALDRQLADLVPGIPARDIAAMRDLALENYCTVFAYSRDGAPGYAHAVALIRAELPPLLRLSCLHEELAQGMGLANDSPRARPTVFNDDEEFALLTHHDELLLALLYDPRLRPGMKEAEATPIIRQIAMELLPD